jgi:(1->4)-alpha-D-glucan 1-alpha-D-glucosylmutase
MLKALRESKTHSQWTAPDVAYEEATQQFIDVLLSDSKDNSFLDDFMLFHRKVAFFGLFNSLAQVGLKLTVPGVPDVYQGSELWDYRLVDPDNRQPVDYRRRREMLAELRQKLSGHGQDVTGLVKGLLRNHQTGQIKLYIIWRILQARRRHRDLFQQGAYNPVEVAGTKKEHVCAFARNLRDDSVITVAARLVSTLTQGAQRGALDPEVWQDTRLVFAEALAPGNYRDVLTEQVMRLGPGEDATAIRNLLGLLPIAVLERVE